jgi:hypothetical protein
MSTARNFTASITRAPVSLVLACSAICLYFLLSFLFYLLTSYWPGPIHDYWFEIPKIQDYFDGHLSWRELVTAHANAHRLVIPRLLFIADYVWFHGDNTLLIFACILCKFGMLALLNIMIRKESTATRWLLNALICSTLFNAINLPNILNSSNVQWDLMAFFSCLAVYFYCNAYPAQSLSRKIIYFLLAYLLFGCAFFSQGGSLPVMFVFLLVAILNRSWMGSLFSFVFICFMYYLMAHVFPVNDEDNLGMASAIAMLILKPKHVALFVLRLMSANIYNIDTLGFVLSSWTLSLLAIGFYFRHQTAHIANNALLYIACFCLIMMLLIAGFRVDFAPGSWMSTRYHANVVLFILVLHLNAFLLAGLLLHNRRLIAARTLLVAMAFINLWIPQYYQRGTSGDFANIFFETQVSGLFYGPSQTSARRLVTSTHDFDKIAEADPFFRAHGFAYYANKQGAHNFPRTKNPGELLITTEKLSALDRDCPVNTATITYVPDDNGDAQTFAANLNTSENSLLSALFTRNTFYAVDDAGIVAGYAWLFVDTEHYFSSAQVRGLVRSKSVKYIVDIQRDQLHCRYRLANPKT